jgi:hypothetical protein
MMGMSCFKAVKGAPNRDPKCTAKQGCVVSPPGKCKMIKGGMEVTAASGNNWTEEDYNYCGTSPNSNKCKYIDNEIVCLKYDGWVTNDQCQGEVECNCEVKMPDCETY